MITGLAQWWLRRRGIIVLPPVLKTGASIMADTPAAPQEDFGPTFQLSAVYANRVIVTLGPIVRITFGETYSAPDGKPQNRYHTAVALPHQTAIELANILKNLLAGIEKDFEQFRAEQERQASLPKPTAIEDRRDG